MALPVLFRDCKQAFRSMLFVCTFISSAIAQQNDGGRIIPFSILSTENLSTVDQVSPNQIKVEFRGKTVDVGSIAKRQRVKIAIVLDTSGSMISEKRKWDAAFVLAKRAAYALSANADVSLVAFGNNMTKVTDAKQGLPAIIGALDLYHSGADKNMGAGRTQLRDAIETALEIEKLQAGDAVVAITDGGDNYSHRSDKDLEWMLERRGVRVMALLIVPRFQTPEEKGSTETFIETAEKTGGASFIIQDPDQKSLAHAVDFTEQIALHPFLAEVPLSADSDGKLKITVLDDSGKKRAKMKVYAPEYLRKLEFPNLSAGGR